MSAFLSGRLPVVTGNVTSRKREFTPQFVCGCGRKFKTDSDHLLHRAKLFIESVRDEQWESDLLAELTIRDATHSLAMIRMVS